MTRISYYGWCVVLVAVLAWKAEGLASQSGVYKDALCQDELATVLTFMPTVDPFSEELAEGNWNECNAFGFFDSLSVMPMCDPVTGYTSFVGYIGGTCSGDGNEVVTSINCGTPPDGYEPIEGFNASVSSQCIDGVSATDIFTGGLIFTAEEYSDASCNNPTGSTLDIDLSLVAEVADALGHGVCGKSACMEGGTLIIQQFATDEDSVCYSGKVAKEIRAPDAGDYISLVVDALCVPWGSTGLYYRPTSCTRTIPTPAPTPAPTDRSGTSRQLKSVRSTTSVAVTAVAALCGAIVLGV